VKIFSAYRYFDSLTRYLEPGDKPHLRLVQRLLFVSAAVLHIAKKVTFLHEVFTFVIVA